MATLAFCWGKRGLQEARPAPKRVRSISRSPNTKFWCLRVTKAEISELAKQNYSDAVFDHEGIFDREATISDREGKPTQFVAPKQDQKWRARDLVDIHWKLTGIEAPSESYNRIFSCIIGHANPKNGVCYVRQKVIAIETGYSRDTVGRVVRWWKKQGFLETESRGLAHALAYHPQWDLLEMHWLAVNTIIQEQKACNVTQSSCSTKGQHACSIKGQHDEPHHAATQNLKVVTSKKESHPERVRPTSLADTVANEGQKRGKEESIQRGEVESASINSNLHAGPTYDEAYSIVSAYCRDYHWDLLTEDDLDTATRAELRQSGAGRAAIDAAFKQRIEEKGAQDV